MALNPSGKDRDGHAFWLGLEQRLPHNSAVFYRFDRVQRNVDKSKPFMQHSIGAVYTVQDYLRLAVEGFVKDSGNESYGMQFQAMLNF